MVRPNLRRAAARLLVAIAAAGVSACTQPPDAVLTDLSSVNELKSRFNADAGQVRVVLLLSPT